MHALRRKRRSVWLVQQLKNRKLQRHWNKQGTNEKQRHLPLEGCKPSESNKVVFLITQRESFPEMTYSGFVKTSNLFRPLIQISFSFCSGMTCIFQLHHLPYHSLCKEWLLHYNAIVLPPKTIFFSPFHEVAPFSISTENCISVDVNIF